MSKKESKEKLEKEKFHRIFRRRYCCKITIVVLLALLIISIFSGGFKDFFTTSVKSQKAAEQSIDYINANLLQGDKAFLKGVSEISSIYKIDLEVGGQRFESYVTKDGKFLFPSGIDMTEKIETVTTPTGVATMDCEDTLKSEKPIAELYIFSYCPAGSSTLDTFAEAGKLLKNVADVKVKFFSDMHGSYEKQQNIIQECIQRIDNDGYWEYAIQFLEEVYRKCGPTRDKECDKTESIKLMEKLGVDADAVMDCVNTEGEILYEEDKKDAMELGLRYSPSVVVNGVYIPRADRSSEGLKTLICCGFNEEPEECKTTLGTTTQTSGNC